MGKVSYRERVIWGKCHMWNVSDGECVMAGKCHVGKVPCGKVPNGERVKWS